MWQWLCPEHHSTRFPACVRGPLSGHVLWHPSSGTPELSTGWFALHASAISLLLLLDTADFLSLTSASPARPALSTCSTGTGGARSHRWITAEITCAAARDKSQQGKPGHATQQITIGRKNLQSEEKKMHASKEDKIGASLE